MKISCTKETKGSEESFAVYDPIQNDPGRNRDVQRGKISVYRNSQYKIRFFQKDSFDTFTLVSHEDREFFRMGKIGPIFVTSIARGNDPVTVFL